MPNGLTFQKPEQLSSLLPDKDYKIKWREQRLSGGGWDNNRFNHSLLVNTIAERNTRQKTTSCRVNKLSRYRNYLTYIRTWTSKPTSEYKPHKLNIPKSGI